MFKGAAPRSILIILLEIGWHQITELKISLCSRKPRPCSCLSTFLLKYTLCPSSVDVSPKFSNDFHSNQGCPGNIYPFFVHIHSVSLMILRFLHSIYHSAVVPSMNLLCRTDSNIPVISTLVMQINGWH